MKPGGSEKRGRRLAGLNVLVVEDEAVVFFLVEEMLRELGCAAIWHAGRTRKALAVLGERQPDAAVLDVNLAGELVYPIARRLAEGGIPFIFATGCGRHGIPGEWAAIPIVQKPFSREQLGRALEFVISERPQGCGRADVPSHLGSHGSTHARRKRLSAVRTRTPRAQGR